jgi:hypothetical protein
LNRHEYFRHSIRDQRCEGILDRLGYIVVVPEIDSERSSNDISLCLCRQNQW